MNKLTIGKIEYEVKEENIPQVELKFYKDNPRIYSLINIDGTEPTQESIQAALMKMEHVRQLKLSIEANGGLIDPLIVLEDKFVVLEGNSRLAAYRMLAGKDPLKWNKVKCLLLPKTISEDSIFTLLGQYHLIGRKDWSVFEQAGYLYRKMRSSDTPIDVIARDLGLKLSDAKKYILVYTFMLEHNDLRQDRWSFYDEYLKHRGIQKYRQTTTDIDDMFVSKVKTGEIRQAIDVREKLGAIAKSNGKEAKKIMQDFINGDLNIYDGYEKFESTGRTNDSFQTLQRFRERLERDDFQQKIKSGDAGKIRLELKKIKKTVDKLIKEFEGE